jgi:putative ABC transport system permease protein
MPNPAVTVIARWEWSRRWRTLLALGIAGGLLGGLVVGGVVLARRTISAPTRLFTAVAPGDVHVRVFDADVAARAARLPEVEASWVGGVAIGRIEGTPSLQYSGIVAPMTSEGPLVRPIVVAGRAADATNPAEVMVTESIAEQARLGVGDRLTLAMLSAEEVFQFDTGFGEPDGPTLELTVVGVLRVPPGLFDGTPMVTTPAFAATHRDLFSGFDVHAQLHGGSTSVAAYTDAVNRLADPTGDAAADDFALVGATRPRDGTDNLIHSSRVLIAGLIAAVAVAGLAVAAALAQAWSRHHGAAAGTQRVEAALGLTSGQRVLARVLPAAAAAVLAGAIAAVLGAAASWKQPIGSLWRVEPDRGWRSDWVAVALGGIAVVAAMSVLAGATAWRTGRRGADVVAAPHGRRLRLAPSRGGWPLAGAAFALAGGHGGRRVPMRMSLAACVVGVAGLVGSITFAASLDRLVQTPMRWGWDADFVIADVNDAVIDETLADPRLDAVSDVYSAEAVIEGRPVDAYAVRKRRGDTGWVLQQGRQPASPTEVVLGSKLASQLDVRVGDRVTSGDGSAFVIVGLGLGPTSNLERLGTSALFTFDGLSHAATTTLFREALIRVAAGPDELVDAVVADYSRYELTTRFLPAAVRDVSELGSLPALLGAFLAVLAAIALVHALVVTTAGRSRDLAVLRALGSTPRRAGLAVLAMSLTSALVGMLGGVPLGYGVARLLWGEVARSIGVNADVAVSARLLLVPLGVVLGAALLAAIPAVRAARRPPGPALRAG